MAINAFVVCCWLSVDAIAVVAVAVVVADVASVVAVVVGCDGVVVVPMSQATCWRRLGSVMRQTNAEPPRLRHAVATWRRVVVANAHVFAVVAIVVDAAD